MSQNSSAAFEFLVDRSQGLHPGDDVPRWTGWRVHHALPHPVDGGLPGPFSDETMKECA